MLISSSTERNNRETIDCLEHRDHRGPAARAGCRLAVSAWTVFRLASSIEIGEAGTRPDRRDAVEARARHNTPERYADAGADRHSDGGAEPDAKPDRDAHPDAKPGIHGHCHDYDVERHSHRL
jgi:hypothetical protein